MEFVPAFVVQFGLVVQASSIVILNLKDFAIRLIRARCSIACVLFGLSMLVNEFAMKGKTFANSDLENRYILNLWHRVSVQTMYRRIHSLRSSLGSKLSYTSFSRVLDMNRGFTIPQGVLSFKFIESFLPFTRLSFYLWGS